MTALAAAISWGGTNVVLSLFVVWPTAERRAVAPPALAHPAEVRTYDLDDDGGYLGSKSVTEIDVVFRVVPPDLDQLVQAWLASSMAAGATVAWFAFEGSFHFEHLLTADVADQVYAVADAHSVALATDDDHRATAGWAARLAVFRRALADDR